MAWLSPAYPVGAFSYSSGIEWAVEAGDIVDAETLRDWLAAMMADGAGFCDAVFLRARLSAAATDDDAGLRAVAELAAALAPSRERFLETTAQGRAFLDATRAAWPCAALDRLATSGPDRSPIRLRSASLRPATTLRLQPALRRLSAGARRQLGIGRRASDPARPDRRPAHDRRARSRALRRPRSARSQPARRGRQRDVPRRHRQHAA